MIIGVAELERAVLALESLDLEGLRAAWRQRWGAPPRLRSPQLLRHLIAWRIQAEALGGLGNSETRRLLRRSGTAVMGPGLQPGQRLTREWRGTRYDVEVVEGRLTHAGKTYKSLSEIARAIFGRWNRAQFFGLRDAP